MDISPVRQEILKKQYNFVCGCEVCKDSDLVRCFFTDSTTFFAKFHEIYILRLLFDLECLNPLSTIFYNEASPNWLHFY